MYEYMYLGNHCLMHCDMKGMDQVGSKEVFQVGEYVDSLECHPGLGYFTSQIW